MSFPSVNLLRPALLTILLLVVIPQLGAAYPGAAEEASAWVPGADYDPSIPPPSSVLGHPLGQAPASVPAVVAYARLLANSSPRVRLEELGESTEGDPLLLLAITDEGSQAGLDDRAQRMRILADPQSGGEERARARELTRPAVWIGCSVHGDEASGVDAGLWLAYHLAADRSAETRELLGAVSVLIDPCQNPDGRRRFLQHLRSFGRIGGGPDPTPRALEHTQLWPGGRYNHYFFDLNRDWAFLTQAETRARVAAFLRWRPQVFVDLHEMGHRSSYFFPPVADPVNPILPPELGEWLESFGRANAAAFDAAGLDYYVGEDFDLFYPGYGDSWPSLFGAIGMTFEQATSRGLLITDANGKDRRYLDTVRGHFIASLATLRHAAANADALLDYFEQYQRRALQEGSRGEYAEYLVRAEDHPSEAKRLMDTLVAQGVEVWITDEDRQLSLRRLPGGEEERLELSRGSYRIPLEQPAYPVLRNLLDPELPIDPAFLEEESERHELGLPNRFYDVTAWSLPLSHGLALYASRSSLSVDSRRYDPTLDTSVSDTTTAGAEYGYLLPYRDSAVLRALALLWKHGVRVHLAREAMRRGEDWIPAGSLVVKRGAQDPGLELDELVNRILPASGAAFLPVASAWSEEGPSLGSNQVVPLRRPRILVLSGPGVRPGSVGSLQWTLEQEFGVEYSPVSAAALSAISLRETDVVVLPGLDSRKPQLPLEELRSWVAAGGTLVAYGSAVPELLAVEDWLSARVIEDLSELEESTEEDTQSEDKENNEPSRARSTPEERRKPSWTPGAILELELLPRHFLGFGAPESGLSALVLGDRILEAGERSQLVASYAELGARRAGFVWPRMEEALPGMAYALVEKEEKGKVILIAEEPTFRAAWPVTTRILLNAILLGPSLAR